MVSAIITTYHRDTEIIERAILSIIQQTHSEIELLLIDDNENDSVWSKNIQEFLKKYPDVIYVKQDGNKGACAARNLGIKHAKGEYIAFLDDDDTWLPEKIETQLQAFSAEEIGMVYCCGYLVDENEANDKSKEYYNAKTFSSDVSFEMLLSYDFVGSTSNPLIRAKCFEVCGGFEVSLPARQDYEMWIRIATKFKIRGVQDKLFLHYIHAGEQISKNTRKSFLGYQYIYNTYKNAYRKYPGSEVNITRNLCALSRYIGFGEFIKYGMIYFINLVKVIIIRK